MSYDDDWDDNDWDDNDCDDDDCDNDDCDNDDCDDDSSYTDTCVKCDDFVNPYEKGIRGYDHLLKMKWVSSALVFNGVGNTAIWSALENANDDDAVILLAYLLTCNPPEDPNRANPNTGWTPLHYACAFNKPDSLNLLLNFNADRSLKDNNNLTPLELAQALKNRGLDTSDCIKILSTYFPTKEQMLEAQEKQKMYIDSFFSNLGKTRFKKSEIDGIFVEKRKLLETETRVSDNVGGIIGGGGIIGSGCASASASVSASVSIFNENIEYDLTK
jgi:hypothetical protein